MPYDLDAIKAAGGTSEKLKAKFNAENVKPGSGIEKLTLLSASRINEGLQCNFRDVKIWWAIDKAYDVNQRQASYTLLHEFFNRKPRLAREDVLAKSKEWGLDHLLTPLEECGKPKCNPATGDPLYKLDLPVFFQIFVPLVQAYHKGRVAKLFTDRDTYPLYPYDPIVQTMANRLKADIITGRVQRIASDCGLRATERQSIHQCALYGISWNFPMEEWFKEERTIDGRKRVVKEGIRYATPHPSRTIYDLAHPASTANSDTGVGWAGYWDIVRFGELMSDKSWWNKETIKKSYGRYAWLKSDGWRLYQELFPCRFDFPSVTLTQQGAGEQDRIERAYYNSREDFDRGVIQVSMFQKLVPKEWDLYDWDEPIWHRMVFAAEDTVIWCQPVAYSPNVVYLYDHDQGRAFNSSLGLELMPWQDMLGNYLTQLLLSVRQNLINVVFWNQDLLDQKHMDLIADLGEKLYTQTNFIPFSKREQFHQQQQVKDVFHRVDMPRHDVNGILVAINTMLNIMERVQGYSPEEMGSRGASEETATRTTVRDRNRNVRMAYTGSFIDEARQARKVQLYEGVMSYSDDEIFAEVADLNEAKTHELEEMGFKVESVGDGKTTKAGVRGSKKGLFIDGFATDRDATNRLPDPQIAQTMIQTFQSIFSSPAIVQQAGIGQLIDLFNQMLYYAGLPKDFRLRINESAPPEQQAQGLQEQLGAALAQVQEQSVAAAQQMINQELSALGTSLRDEVIAPIQQQQQQMGEALVMVLKKIQEGEQVDAEQSAVLQRLIQMLEMAGAGPGMMNPS